MDNDAERSTPPDAEGDELARVAEDNSLGRLLALCDGVFAIAMTLLALDLRVPDLGGNPSDSALRHALWDNRASYLSFLISFYVVAGYWSEHRTAMRSVTRSHPRLSRHTIPLLLLVAALPFPAALLGEYGSVPFALAMYGTVNAVIVLLLARLRHDVRALGVAPAGNGPAQIWDTWGDLGVFLLCIPGAYLLDDKGPYLLLLLIVSGRGTRRLSGLTHRNRR